MSLEPEQLQSLFVFSLAVHDLGKFARAFQSLAEPDLPELVTPDSSLAYGTQEWPHHSEAGRLFFSGLFSRASSSRKVCKPGVGSN
ncbi:hypothetical protein CF392_16265 [Tamilnaduibacter salinus]|uniref:HD Cas3-type domain-containing protein n=2 Tax=Tamilnaduibacter salinus TaxID=1484056 RepID=A0A2A2HZX4_9GAMM|nr:hypothetical protein CF392_16265 [Tamilnaduibacter salinus]